VTSILTNISAVAALQTLQTVNSDLVRTQQQVSSGYRVSSASDDVAYWSISTTMRSDNVANSAVSDALGIGAARIDIAYSGIDAVSDILSEFKAKLVTAKEDGMDKAKIQADLDQLKEQVVGISSAASFNGRNWLSTDVEDINDSDLNRETLTTSFIRKDGGVSVGTTDLHLSDIALFNENGGGLLQADTRKMKTLGGVRLHDTFMDTDGIVQMFPINDRGGINGRFDFTFSGPITFSPTDTISFDVTVDVDNPADLDPPYNTGKTTHVQIDRAFVNAWLPGQNGVISTYQQYSSVLYRALTAANSGAAASLISDGHGGTVPNEIAISTRENSGLNGSSVQISNFVSTPGPTGLGDTAIHFGSRGSQMTLDFAPFEVYRDGQNEAGVQVDFNFSVNGAAPKHYSFDRSYVNDLLGKDTGKIETVDEMVTLLDTLMGDDWPDVIIEATPGGDISIKSDKAVDRLSGMRTSIGFTEISVSIEPIGEQDFLDIDIVTNPDWLDRYIGYIEVVSADVVTAGATLGAVKNRISQQEEFNQKQMDAISEGVSRLIDTNMEEASAKLAAIQTQQELALQSLQIANTNPQNLMQLFN
jgi:flagellin